MTTFRGILKYSALLWVLLQLGACGESEDAARFASVKPGQPFPGFSLPDATGSSPQPLSVQTGKVLIVNFWATWCGPCREEMPSLQRLSETLDPDRFAVWGVSVDRDDHLVKEFLNERRLRFANLLDHGGEVFNEVLGGSVLPSTFLVAPDGTLAELVVGAREWDDPEVLDRLQSLAVSAN